MAKQTAGPQHQHSSEQEYVVKARKKMLIFCDLLKHYECLMPAQPFSLFIGRREVKDELSILFSENINFL